MSNRTRRVYTSAGQKKQPDAEQRPKLARVRLPSANALPHPIIVRYPGVCVRADCGAKIASGEPALYDPEDATLCCRRCAWRLRQAALDSGRG
jgi:hypothetical protein